MEMRNAYLLFSGYYDVAAASDVLHMYNIKNHIVRAPVSRTRGCSYAVMVDAAEEKMSRYILKNKGIKML